MKYIYPKYEKMSFKSYMLTINLILFFFISLDEES